MAGAETPARDGRRAAVMRDAVLDRLPLKAAALFFATMLWLAVRADEPSEHTVAVRLAVQVDSVLRLRRELPVVTATLTGRRRDLLKLRSGDLVLRRAVARGVADSVRLVLRPGDVEIPSGSEGEVRVRDVQPRQITLHFSHDGRHAPGTAARPAPPARATAVAAPPPLDPAHDVTEDAEATVDTLWEAAADSPATPARAASRRRTTGGPPPDVSVTPAEGARITIATPAGAPFAGRAGAPPAP